MKNNNQLVAVVEKSGLNQKTKVDELMSSFTGFFDEARKLADDAKNIIVKDESDVYSMSSARSKRLEIRRVRIEAEKTRVELKAQSLRESRAIDGVANVIKALIVPVEERLEKQEKYAENKEKEMIEKRNSERVEKLSKYVEDVALYYLKEIEDEAFEKLLSESKKAHFARIEAEEKVEAERIAKEKAEREEARRIKEENERLRKEAEEKEMILEKEREVQQEKIEAEKKKTEAVEARLKAEKDAQELKERKEREVIEAKKEAEEDKKRQDMLAPDKEKLIKFASEIDNLKLPALASKSAGDVINMAEKKLSDISNYLREKAKTL